MIERCTHLESGLSADHLAHVAEHQNADKRWRPTKQSVRRMMTVAGCILTVRVVVPHYHVVRRIATVGVRELLVLREVADRHRRGDEGLGCERRELHSLFSEVPELELMSVTSISAPHEGS